MNNRPLFSPVTPSESTLCKFRRFPPNPHRNDSKVPTRHFRAGGKRSNNITQQSSMGPTEQIYITATQRVKNTDIQYKDPNHLENDRASEYGQRLYTARLEFGGPRLHRYGGLK